MSKMKDKLKKEIFEYVKVNSVVSFMELSRLEGFKGEYDYLVNGDKNIVYWCGISKDAVEAIHELVGEEKINPSPCTSMLGGLPLVYLCDGGCLRLPLAKKPPHGGYKKPHWLPIVYNYGPSPYKKLRETIKEKYKPGSVEIVNR
jgi:hypothetical protein